jgi:sugar lactone lactonase YvrE
MAPIFPAGHYVLFSDIPNNRIMRLGEDDDHVSVFRQPSMKFKRQYHRSIAKALGRLRV